MNESSKLLDDILMQLGQLKNQLRIEDWNCFELDFATPFQHRNSIISVINANTGMQPGLYAIFDQQRCLYIGIGRPIRNRLKAHYYAAQGKEKIKRWSDFFQQQQKPLTIYWLPFSCSVDAKTDDMARRLAEAILTGKYQPVFEQTTSTSSTRTT